MTSHGDTPERTPDAWLATSNPDPRGYELPIHRTYATPSKDVADQWREEDGDTVTPLYALKPGEVIVGREEVVRAFLAAYEDGKTSTEIVVALRAALKAQENA